MVTRMSMTLASVVTSDRPTSISADPAAVGLLNVDAQ